MKISIDLDELTAENSQELYTFLDGYDIPYDHVFTKYDGESDERIKELEQAVSSIAPWLSASLSCELSEPCEEYKQACDKIFNVDKGD